MLDCLCFDCGFIILGCGLCCACVCVLMFVYLDLGLFSFVLIVLLLFLYLSICCVFDCLFGSRVGVFVCISCFGCDCALFCFTRI